MEKNCSNCHWFRSVNQFSFSPSDGTIEMENETCCCFNPPIVQTVKLNDGYCMTVTVFPNVNEEWTCHNFEDDLD